MKTAVAFVLGVVVGVAGLFVVQRPPVVTVLAWVFADPPKPPPSILCGSNCGPYRAVPTAGSGQR